MGLTKVTLLFALAALCTTNAFNTLVPKDKEVLYNWRATVRAGTDFPARFASQFVIHGKLHVQADDNATLVKITDLKQHLYNGHWNHVLENEAQDLPMPQEMKDMEHTFKIIHDTNGHAMGIITETSEKEFSRNMKKSIASILQVDTSAVKDTKIPHGFVTKEHSLYGFGKVDYNVVPHGEKLIVRKMHDMVHANHLFQHFHSNTEKLACDVEYEESLMHDSVRKYIITQEGGHHMVKRIEAAGTIMYNPLRAKSDSQFLSVNQTFDVVNIAAIQTPLKVENPHFENHLTYRAFDEHAETETAPDILNGRRQVNYEKLLPEITEMLEEAVKYLENIQIDMKKPDTKRGQTINRIVRLMMVLNVQRIEELHTNIKQKNNAEILDMFYRILPLVGTRGSALVIKKMIVGKIVDDDVAAAMLEHMPEHLLVPTPAFIAEMEELIHFPETISWNLRKMALMSFGAMVHKSVDFTKKMMDNHEMHTRDPEEMHDVLNDQHRMQEIEHHFEKYVLEFINKVKSAKEYKIQMVYLQALFNMKLRMTLKYIEPMMHEEWVHDHHLRLMGMWAMLPAVLGDANPSDKTIEIFWPIMTNRNEHTELRIVAYWFIMESKPHLSKLMSIRRYLMREPNQELYHFHWSYVKNMMNSHEPCRKGFSLHLAQMMKSMHPPSHGLSSIDVNDYRDIDFGFSGGYQMVQIHTNESQLFSVMTTSQLANIHHEDHVVYVKLHKVMEAFNGMSHLMKMIEKKDLLSTTTNSDVHVEILVLKQQTIVNSWYFNEKNMNEFAPVLDFLGKKPTTLTKKNMIHIGYSRQHKSIIPSDLGTPAMWDFMVPVVTKIDLNLKKEITNNIMTMEVDYRMVRWNHWREGLSVYNPMGDVWHSVQRYHAYDAILPIHFEVTLNLQQQSLQLSWKKHTDERLNVAGVKAHVKQMVIVKDDLKHGILAKSSPKSLEFLDVGHGEEFKKDFPLFTTDSLNTGHKMEVAAFDTGRHISNGTFIHRMNAIMNPWTKNIDDPMTHMMMSLANWNRYLLLLPQRGTHGYMVKITPSEMHKVTNIDLSLRMTSEITDHTFTYSPGGKLSSRLTYAIKNNDQSLKTWDVNTVLEMNAGHTVNNLKMQLTRIIPGQKDYKICVDGTKKWSHKGVTGHLNIAMSQTADAKCVKDDSVIDITMTGERSHEQEQEHHIYGACHYTIPYGVPHYHTLHCLAAHTSIRHYVYDVNTKNVPTEFKNMITQVWDLIRMRYIGHYLVHDEDNMDIGDHNLRVDVLFPMQEKQIDVKVMTNTHQVHELSGVPTDEWRTMGLIPDSTVYSKMFMFLHKIQEVSHCVVHHDRHSLNGHEETEDVPKEWTLFVGDTAQNPKKAIFIKQVADNKIAVKVVDHSHVMEMMPEGESHQVKIDGKVMHHENIHHEDWVNVLMFMKEVHHPVAVMLPQLGMHMDFDGEHVVIVIPQNKDQFVGHCFEHHH